MCRLLYVGKVKGKIQNKIKKEGCMDGQTEPNSYKGACAPDIGASNWIFALDTLDQTL